MNRIIVEVYLPAAGRTYDLSVPTDVTLAQVARLAAKTLSELSGGLYRADEAAALCDRRTGAFLDANMMVWALENGAQLMLV